MKQFCEINNPEPINGSFSAKIGNIAINNKGKLNIVLLISIIGVFYILFQLGIEKGLIVF